MVRVRAHNLFILFLRRLLGWLGAFTVMLTGVILASHYLITLRFLMPGMVTPRALLMLLPQMVGHALPVALCMSVGLTAHHLHESHEQFMIECLAGVRRAWRRALVLTVSISALGFIVCIGWWGPHYYRQGKQELVASVSRLVRLIPPRNSVSVTPGVQLWYESRGDDNSWENIRFLVRSGEINISLAAKQARLAESAFYLKNGSLYEADGRQSSYHQFGQMTLPYDISGGLQPAKLRPKHATLSQLWAERSDRAMRIEIGRRIIHLFLFSCAPFLLLALTSLVQVHRLLVIVVGSILLSAVMQVVKEVAVLL